ncbi:hypothetical protein KY285_006917 [Solanum tuberosum]|nr:hypothetical protein KY285_006917 [Solanum tuberosum]
MAEMKPRVLPRLNRPDPTRRTRTLPAANENAVVVENLRDRLAETEARLERARAREAELSRQLEEMKRYVCVMEILECYLKRRYREQQVRTLAVVGVNLDYKFRIVELSSIVIYNKVPRGRGAEWKLVVQWLAVKS